MRAISLNGHVLHPRVKLAIEHNIEKAALVFMSRRPIRACCRRAVSWKSGAPTYS